MPVAWRGVVEEYRSFLPVDDDTTEFGSFSRDQVFLVQVRLNISAGQSVAHVALSGAAAGARDYVLPPPSQFLSRQFAAIRVWQGFPHTGGFDATDIVVTREP